MSDKQLTGTITLPGVDPDEYELTGEVRRVQSGEWAFNAILAAPRQYKDGEVSEGVYPILRRKPRKIRVTPTQADLDAATEPIPCWTDTGVRSSLIAIDKFDVGGKPFYCFGHAWVSRCEIEKEVTE